MTSSTTNETKVLDSLILVSLAEIHGISGRKKLKREDLGDGVDLPPDVIVSLGSKKVIDPKLLNPFTQYKTRAHTLCSNVGIRFLGGYAVPADRVNDLITELNDVKTEFYIYKKTFLQSDFDSWIENCEEKYRKILRDGMSVDTDYMESQIQFGFTAIHITPYGNSVIQDGIAAQIKSLSDEVFDEVSSLVDGFLKNLNQNAFTQHTINPLRRTADKLASLGFISDSVNKLSIYMNEVLCDVPLSGKVIGRKYSDILSLLNNLRDPKRAKSFVDLLNADSASQPHVDDYIDLDVVDDEVSHSHPNEPVVNAVSSPAHVADDSHTVNTSSFNSDDFYTESTIVVEDFGASVVETVQPSVAQTSDADITNNDGFSTDFPSYEEIMSETVIPGSSAPAVLNAVSDDAHVVDASVASVAFDAAPAVVAAPAATPAVAVDAAPAVAVDAAPAVKPAVAVDAAPAAASPYVKRTEHEVTMKVWSVDVEPDSDLIANENINANASNVFNAFEDEDEEGVYLF